MSQFLSNIADPRHPDHRRLSLIVAMSEKDRVIGINNRMPWRLAAHQTLLAQHSQGKCVIMGRKAFEALGWPPQAHAHFVVTSAPQGQENPETSALTLCSSVDQAVAAALPTHRDIVFIGGEQTYREGLLYAHEIIASIVKCPLDGDAYFTSFQIDKHATLETPLGFTFGRPFQIQEVLHKQEADELNDFAFTSYRLKAK
jgi:dihydrofolate reductase